MDVPGLEHLRERYLSESTLYGKVAKEVREQIERAAQRRGLRCYVTHRHKDVASFLKKALKGEYADPYGDITDKAGVRVIAHFPWLIPDLEGLVNETFLVHRYANKRLGLDTQILGYRGTHFEVKIQDGPDDLRELICEVQVLTRAESLWADTAHDISYKPAHTPPDHIQRAIYRLVALVEIFDSEIERAYTAIRTAEGFEEAQLLQALEQHYYQFTANPYDRDLSLVVLDKLKAVLPDDDLEQFYGRLKCFIERNREKIEEFYGRHRNDERANPLIWQPETLLVFLLLESDSFRLREAWEQVLPGGLLESLGDAWGAPV